jgi:3-deoxy-D-manno-octulosonate 8-phosphate phosphatase (KDO 8-P phosphatase)
MTPVEERAKRIKIVAFDVDGVMTNGGLILSDEGLESKAFHSLDGLGLKMLTATGIQVALVTARTSNVVIERAKNIKAKLVYQGAENKLIAFEQLLKDTGIAADECAFMGDDVVDLPPLRRCGLAITVPHAMPLVKQYVHYTTERQAGFGAVREVCELIMKAQGTFDGQMARFLE